MYWKSLPRNWMESPFIGNGMMGSMLFLEDDNSLVIQLGRSDVQDHRLESCVAEGSRILPYQSRLPIGYFTLETGRKITGCNLRLNLWDAEISGVLTTEGGEIELSAFMHSERDLLVVDAHATDGEVGVSIVWHPQEAFCPRIRNRRQGGKEYMPEYVPNPLPVVSKEDGIQICVQELLSGGQTATAWVVKEDGLAKKTLFASAAHTFPESAATAIAKAVVEDSSTISLEELRSSHRTWWHEFYPKSFVSLPDAKLESFFWAQNYKMACAARRPEVLADNQGPWLQLTSWPALWWNLNVQLAYSHMLPANHPELSIGLVDRMAQNAEILSSNAPEGMRHDSIALNTISGQDFFSPVKSPIEKPGSCMGNATWVMHNCYMQYRYTMDEELLCNKIYPLLKKSINLYRHLLIEGDDGKLHLPVTSSPEYPKGNAADCNYDLALLRWGCQALIESAETLGIDDPLIPAWHDILDRLVDYPQDENGWMIGKGLPFARSHRHYSHLLMFYPLAIIDLDDAQERALAEKSLLHWQSFPKGLAGYSYSGSSSMFSHLGDGEQAERRLQDFLNDKILVNTFYKEGVSNPVIETPPAAARSIEDMLIQSWGGTIRVFPAITDKWADVAFANLRTEGAFLVSASRKNGLTEFVAVESLAGQPCRLRTGIAGKVRVAGHPESKIRDYGDGTIEFTLPPGERVVFSSATHSGASVVEPVEKKFNTDWRWGIETPSIGPAPSK